MRTTISKQENNQIPTQVEAESNNFQTILDVFFDSSDSKGHINMLLVICKAFTGTSTIHRHTPRASADMVLSVFEITQFIQQIESSYYASDFNDQSLNDIFIKLDMINSDRIPKLLNRSLLQWIDPEEVSFEIEYMTDALLVFRNLCDLIRALEKINMYFLNHAEGGLSC